MMPNKLSCPLLLVGGSLGAGVAAEAASRQPYKVAGLMLITPWDRLLSVAAHTFPSCLSAGYCATITTASPISPHVIAPYSSSSPSETASCPHALAWRCTGRCQHPRRLKVVSGAGHNDWIERVDENWWRESIHFLLGASAKAE